MTLQKRQRASGIVFLGSGVTFLGVGVATGNPAFHVLAPALIALGLVFLARSRRTP